MANERQMVSGKRAKSGAMIGSVVLRQPNDDGVERGSDKGGRK